MKPDVSGGLCFTGSHSSSWNCRRGFTLIELLVVIAIISILAALLLPTLESTLAQAKRMRCLNHLRQLFIPLQFYAQDFGEYPTNYDYAMPTSWNWGDECAGRWVGGPPSRVSWAYATPPYYYPAQGRSARSRFLDHYPDAAPVTKCTAPLPADGANWEYTMRPSNNNRSGNGVYVYDGPHSAGHCLRNNSSMSGLWAMGRHGGGTSATKSGNNWGIRYNTGEVRRNSGTYAVSDIAFLGCPSIYEDSVKLYMEPHGYPERIVSFADAGMGNGQYDRYNAAAYIARNFVYGDGHAIYVYAETRQGFSAP